MYKYTYSLFINELQSLISEANLMTRHVDTKLTMPILPEGVLYEVLNTTVDIPVGLGRIQDLESDYKHANGIGAVVPPIAGFSDILADIQSAASRIITIAKKHTQTLQEILGLTYEHIVHTFPHAKNVSRGGFFRIQIGAKSAVFQILFMTENGLFMPAYEGDLQKMADGSAFESPPFTRIPPLLEVPKQFGATEYVPATYENITKLLESTPHNSPQQQVYRSRSQHILKNAAEMAENLLVA